MVVESLSEVNMNCLGQKYAIGVNHEFNRNENMVLEEIGEIMKNENIAQSLSELSKKMKESYRKERIREFVSSFL
jgi:hypothetical protein